MKTFWARLVSVVGDEPEAAGISILLILLALVSSFLGISYCVAGGHYGLAGAIACFVVTVGVICIRDFQRGHWSVVSRVAAGVWVALTVLAVVYGIYNMYGRG